MSDRSYCPTRGDFVWIDFNPQAGHEQAGLRPALVLSPEAYNRKTGLAIFCPIASQVTGYPFEVVIPHGPTVAGAVLSDQVTSLDWRAGSVRFQSKAPYQRDAQQACRSGRCVAEPV